MYAVLVLNKNKYIKIKDEDITDNIFENILLLRKILYNASGSTTDKYSALKFLTNILIFP